MTTIDKAEIINAVFNKIGTDKIDKKEARNLVENFFVEICEALKEGFNVRIVDLGLFQLRDKAERPGYNPKTGEKVPVTARRVVSFRVGKKLKDKLNLKAKALPAA
jgi:integration host factor subunit alpha